MLARMPWRIFLEWYEYYIKSPFGEVRDDLRAGTIAALVANAWGRKKGQPAFSPVDLMPYLREYFDQAAESGASAGRFSPIPLTPEQMLEKVIKANALLGGETIYQNEGDT